MFCTRCGTENAASSSYCDQCGHQLNDQSANGENRTDSTRSMKGRVLGWDVRAGIGTISGEDGTRYRFQISEWRSGDSPQSGMQVDFLPEDNEAREVFGLPEKLTSNATSNPSQVTGSNFKVAAGLLAILLGWLGIHKFYLGYTGPGVILLLAGTLGWILVVPPLIAAIVGLIEGILYLTKSDEEFVRIYVVGRQEWF